MDKFEIDNVMKISRLISELDLERASALQSKLRWMIKDDSSLKPIRRHLRDLIIAYENTNWRNEKSISGKQIIENDKAVDLILYESRFIQRRKFLIKEALGKYGLTQQHLATILGHRKSYMSELINGIRSFSMSDLTIIHRILKIKLDDLFLTVIKGEIAIHIKDVLNNLDKPNLKLDKADLPELQLEFAGC